MYLYHPYTDSWEEYLERYSDNKFKVQKMTKTNCSKWYEYKSKEYNLFIKRSKYVNHREILPNEVVIDIDADDKELQGWEKKAEALLMTGLIISNLEKEDKSYVCWDSGGDGYHTHMWFPGITELASNKVQSDFLKKEIKKYYTEGVKRDFIKSHLDLNKFRLIAIELSTHRKGKKKELYKLNDVHFGLNRIPEEIIKHFKNTFTKEREEHIKQIRIRQDVERKKMKHIPRCVRFLLSANIKDGRHRTLFVLVKILRKFLDKEELKSVLHDWNDTIHDGHLEDWYINYQLNYHYDCKRILTSRYIKQFFKDLGRVDVTDKCKHCINGL